MVTRLSCYFLKVTNFFRMRSKILDNEYAVYQHHEKELKYAFLTLFCVRLTAQELWSGVHNVKWQPFYCCGELSAVVVFCNGGLVVYI